MEYDLDGQQGQAIGSRIVLRGRALWVEFYVEQVVTEREPPRLKAWETVGQVRLVVVGPYRVEFRIEPASLEGSRLAIDIQCEPVARCPLWLTRLYARWCVWRMASDAARHFKQA
jgi:hypothetical protein